MDQSRCIARQSLAERIPRQSLGTSKGLGDFQKRIYQMQFVVPPLGGLTPPKGGTTNFDLVCFLLEITLVSPCFAKGRRIAGSVLLLDILY
ncbi:hypothetical protein QUF80_18100 [Desulfococcaceae bacterium HSG8]|nr:hypothetical protein [Desulfococcaceae bacterium HSG8]